MPFDAAPYLRPIKPVSTSQDAVKKPTVYIGVDTEFAKYEEDNAAPPLACLTWWLPGDADASICHALDASRVFRGLAAVALKNSYTIVGNHIAADLCILMVHDPSLTPIIFELLDRGLVECTILAEKADDIARGTYRAKIKGKYVDGKVVGYSLDQLVQHRLRIGLGTSEGEEYRVRFGEFIHLPLHMWPAPAVRYARIDAKAVGMLRDKQETDETNDPAASGYYVYANTPMQTRAAFGLALQRMKGIRTDPVQTTRMREKLTKQLEEATELLVKIGWVREGHLMPKAKRWKKPSVKEGEIKKYVVDLATKLGFDYKRTPSGKEASLDAEAISMFPPDPKLNAYRSYIKAEKLVGYTEILSTGFYHAIHSEPNTLVTNGRTSWGSDSPDGAESAKTLNLQQQPTVAGMRDCFIPREGYYFWSVDYSTLELVGVAQVCLWMFKYSRLAELINSGADMHSLLGSMILNISYEEFLTRKGLGELLIKAVRELAKRANFGLWGGMGIKRFLQTLREAAAELLIDGIDVAAFGIELTEEFAKHLKKLWLEMLPETREYFKNAQYVAEGNGLIVEFITNRIRGGLNEERGYSETANDWFSSLCAYAAKESMYKIQRAFFCDTESPCFGNGWMTAFIHDEHFGECRIGTEHYVVPEVKRIAQTTAQEVFPDVQLGCNEWIAARWRKEAAPCYFCKACNTYGKKHKCKCGAWAYARPWEESEEFRNLLAKGEVIA